MDFIMKITSLWDELLIVGICSSLIGAILLGITVALAEKIKLISSMFFAIPTTIVLRVAEIAFKLAIIFGVVQLILKLL